MPDSRDTDELLRWLDPTRPPPVDLSSLKIHAVEREPWPTIPLPGQPEPNRTMADTMERLPIRPARTRPCPCGSGRKYKKCCALSVPTPTKEQ